ncbi:DNA-binding protein [Methylobacterium sp. P1-11]|uniref:helix-turn-helix domain-containing protein n=1 Tax=Methylobacterium sp. P1-11 TaxID=2024616 RepID=UPI0011ED8CBD|nr:helix-turn-helix domain-containing protein [Methylobacterium sp. P1-11]KAA0122079.1 DNA-binding protein [Methylobacterium sp. P1-11]
MTNRLVLIPYIPDERMSPEEGAKLLGVSRSTLLRWSHDFGLGRLIGKKLVLSRVAVQLWIEEQHELLARYHAGDRSSEQIRHQFARQRIELPAEVIAAAAE